MNQQLIQGYTVCNQDDEIISVQKIIYMLFRYLNILIQPKNSGLIKHLLAGWAEGLSVTVSLHLHR